MLRGVPDKVSVVIFLPKSLQVKVNIFPKELNRYLSKLQTS